MTHDHSHNENHDHDPIQFTAGYWDERYRSATSIWSGAPNQRLVEQVAELAPGTALDVGSGEGADAIWLASRGWLVTGADVSQVALDRAAARAVAAGPGLADRITWQQTDVLTWDPAPRQFDLVSAQFMHLPEASLFALHRRLAAAVRPGGSLLVVGHHPADVETRTGRSNRLELMFTAEQVAATLDPDAWTILVAAAPERELVGPEGRPITFRDAVLHAVRR